MKPLLSKRYFHKVHHFQQTANDDDELINGHVAPNREIFRENRWNRSDDSQFQLQSSYLNFPENKKT